MELSVSSYQSLEVELWTGLIPAEKIADPFLSGEFIFVNKTWVENPSFKWQIDRAEYFTFKIIDREETLAEDFDITLDLRFLNYWELEAP